MLARALAPAALVLALIAPVGPASAQHFRYAPGTNQYRLTMQAKVTQVAMGDTNETDVSSGQRFTVAMTRQADDTMAMTITIDSISQNMGKMGPVPGLDKLVGRKVHAWLSPSGQFYSSKAPDADSVAALAGVADQLVHVFPQIRGTLSNGSTWTDTTNADAVQSGLEVKRQVISTYTVEGDTAVAGKTALRVRRASTSTSTGVGSIQGQHATLSGMSSGTGTLVVTREGDFLGATGAEDAKVKLTLTDAGVAYDIGTSATTKLERLN